jgi:hypothetical protein
VVERVSTAVPFPRGMVIVDERMYVLSRGRVRSAGGVSAAVADRAGTLWTVDRDEVESPVGEPGERVRGNGAVFAEPSDPPFRLWDRASSPPESDRRTDRPYCVLRYDEASRNFFICAFSGVDMKREAGRPSFSKNYSDGVLRFDVRVGKWFEVERHEAGSAEFPHHDVGRNAAPHGWLKGPNNLVVVGEWLYAVGKDNHRMVRYPLAGIRADAGAGAPGGSVVLGEELKLKDGTTVALRGHSGLAWHEGWLYLATRTSGHVVRMRVGEDGSVREAELLGLFDEWDPATGKSADITDIAVDAGGMVYVLCAEPLAVHRFRAGAEGAGGGVYDARGGKRGAWADVAGLLGKPKLKGENLMLDPRGFVYLSTGDGYGYQGGAEGTIYRLREAGR